MQLMLPLVCFTQDEDSAEEAAWKSGKTLLNVWKQRRDEVNTYGGLKQSFSDHCISANLYMTAKLWMDAEQFPTGRLTFFLVWFWFGSSDFNVLAFQCHQSPEAQLSFSRNLNLEDYMWTQETIRKTTSEPLYPASSSSYMQLPA